MFHSTLLLWLPLRVLFFSFNYKKITLNLLLKDKIMLNIFIIINQALFILKYHEFVFYLDKL